MFPAPVANAVDTFYHRRWDGGTMVERFVQAAREDKRWSFHQSGDPLPEEDVAAYTAKRKRARLNEVLVAQLLGRLGASPWLEEFYAFPEQRCFVLQRPAARDRPTAERFGGRATGLT